MTNRVFLSTLFVALLTGCPAERPRQSCESGLCHGPAGKPNGIEDAHAAAFLSCTDCHGGDGKAKEKELAHVLPAPQWVADRGGYLRNLSVNELDAVDPAYLRFSNPGDYRAAEQSCGSNSPSVNATGCHQDVVYSAQRSSMATFTGHFDVPRFQAGIQGREAVFGSRSLNDPQRPNPAPPGTVASIQQAVIPPDNAPRDTVATAIDHYLPKNCTHCHQWNYGKNDARGNFRSSGCTACHMLYTNDGISESSDPSAIQQQPPHPAKHELTVAIPGEQCEHCHHQGARIGLLYRGVIEWGFPGPPPFPNIGESLHNHPPEFYLQASSDSAHPADLHFDAGMTCMDCHVGRDVHGDGRLYSTSKFQVAVRCENCHGNIDSTIALGTATPPITRSGVADDCQPPGDGSNFYLNCAGDPLKNITQRDNGTRWLQPAMGGPELAMLQIKDTLDRGNNLRMIEAMGRDQTTGFSHTEVIECDGCHTAYRQYCFGCHVTIDYSQQKSDLLTGQRTTGAEITERFFQSLDLYFLGENHRGKIGSFCPSMQVFFGAVERDMNNQLVTIFDNRIRTSATGKTGFNWAVDAPHVVSRIPQNCSRCHQDANNGCDDSLARESFGFGAPGKGFMFTDDNNVTHDLTQLLDPSGIPLVDFSHEGQGPVRPAVRASALSICVTDHPR